MSVFLDSRAHATAVKTAIETQVGPIPDSTDTRVYDYDEIPGANGNSGTLPNMYVAVSIERRYNPNLRITAQAGSAGWRVAARAVGSTVDECRWLLLKVATALNENTLTVSGQPTTPVQFETDEVPQRDEQSYTAVAFYIYAR